MKRSVWLLALVLLVAGFGQANAGAFLGVKKASEKISFPLMCLDSAGLACDKPDSIHVLTYADNNTAASFTTRSVTWPFSDINVDTVKIYGDTSLWFNDQIQNIDGTGANFQLAIDVRTWIKKIATDNIYTVQVINDSLVKDISTQTGKAAGDSTWGKAYGTSFTAGTMGDSLNNLSYVGGLTTALQASVAKAAGDSTWGKAFSTSFTAGSMGDSLNNLTYVGGLTTALQASLPKAAADSVWGKAFSTAYTAGTMGDSLNNFSYVGGVAGTISNANMGAIGDSVWNKLWSTAFAAGSMGDTLNNFSPLRAAAKSIFDSTATVITVSKASADSTWNKAFSTAFTGGSMGDSLNNLSYVGGGSATVSNGNMAAIADSVWNKLWSTAFAAGSMGDSLNNFTPLRAAAKSIFDSTATVVTVSKASADSVWNKSFGTTFAVGSMGDSANNASWIQGLGANAITSATISTTADDEIADAIWNEDTTSHNLAATFGYVNNGKNWATPSSVADTFWNKNFATSFATGSMGDSLNNSSYVGSGTGGPDSTKVARWVWNTPHLNHVISGTFGRYLDVPVSGLGAGAGAYARTIVVIDTAQDVTVNGAAVSIRPLNQSNLIATGSSNSAGRAYFNLNADSFLVITNGPGLMFTVYDTIVVAGAGTDSVYGYRFNPSAPALNGICRVWGYLFQVDGTPGSGARIDVSLPRGVSRAGSILVSPFAVQSVTDATGYFAIDLIWSSALTPSGTEYEFAITRSDGTILRKRISVPGQPTWQFNW